MGAFLVPNAHQREASVALLREWGIDGNAVLADGWDREGYELAITGEPGARLHLKWPSGFPVEKLFEIRGGFQ